MLIDTSCVTGVLLAGGQSRRMFAGEAGGGDKGLLMLGRQPMIARVMARLAPQVGRMVLNVNGDPGRFAALGLPVAPDPVTGFVGPLAGVLAGMCWSLANAPEARFVATVSTDAPFIPTDLVARLAHALLYPSPQVGQGGGDGRAIDVGLPATPIPSPRGGGERIALAQSGGELHPVIGLWPVALAGDLEASLASGTRKVLAWTDRHGTIPVPFPPERVGSREVDPFFNANTPEELAEARAILES
jgi:molybdopterin-guanine dinucleotide biosynthesis protein A